MSSLPGRYVGALQCLQNASSISSDAVQDDQEEELESYDSAVEIDEQLAHEDLDNLEMDAEQFSPRITPRFQKLSVDTEDVGDDLSGDASVITTRKIDHEMMFSALKVASKNVVGNTTLQLYIRLWILFINFCLAHGFIQHEDAFDTTQPNFSSDLPTWIALWIMDKCDDMNIHTGQVKALDIRRGSYNMAQKMRAAMTHKFGRDYQLGTQAWQEHPVTGKYIGNPSLSVVLSQYMVSLRRRKAHAGEEVTSARAIDERTLKMLWLFNIQVENTGRTSISRKDLDKDPSKWGGANVRIMLHLLYLISMLCLLRYDEALHIMWTDIFVEKREGGKYSIELQLPFRKTHPTGGIAPFVLWGPDCDRPWMCPVRALSEWSAACRNMGIRRDGYVFRKKVGVNSISADIEAAMTSESFLECFRNNLLDINIDPRPYGTHSFRRGGCQYLAMVLRWPFQNICSWGGWSPKFDNPGTIFKYLLSWTDTPLVEREDYFNPDRPASDPCHACGRTCSCA